jgi:hypothetical protein
MPTGQKSWSELVREVLYPLLRVVSLANKLAPTQAVRG